jgi:hypothetical protein
VRKREEAEESAGVEARRERLHFLIINEKRL